MQVLIIMECILIVAAATVGIISIMENKRLTISRYEICSAKIPQEFHGCRFVVLADLHDAVFGNENERLLQLIEEEQPDYILLAGDMLIGQKGHSSDAAAALICRLAERYPVYYGLGNHEQRIKEEPEIYGDMWQAYCEMLSDKVILLENQQAVIRRGKAELCVYGLALDKAYYKRFHRKELTRDGLNQLLGEADTTKLNLLLAHTPEYFKAYAEWGANLVFSGHLHGGMIRLPFLGGMISPRVRIFPKYDRGRYEENGSTMLLSGGLGNHTLKIRVNNPPEVLVVTLQRKE